MYVFRGRKRGGVESSSHHFYTTTTISNGWSGFLFTCPFLARQFKDGHSLPPLIIENYRDRLASGKGP